MAEPAGSGPATGTAGARHHSDIDWLAAERSPEFQELVRKRRSFVIPALAFVFVWYFGFIALAGYAPEFMGESVIEGLTIGYLFALSQFVMTWVLAWLYLRRAYRDFDPLAAAAAKTAIEAGRGRSRDEASPASPGGGVDERRGGNGEVRS